MLFRIPHSNAKNFPHFFTGIRHAFGFLGELLETKRLAQHF